MKKYQETVYKAILAFSALINVFLLLLLFWVVRDSLAGRGDWLLEGRSFWFFVSVVVFYSLANAVFVFRLLSIKSEGQ